MRKGGLLVLAALAFTAGAWAEGRDHWVASWASSQMVAVGDNALPAAQLTDATLRQYVQLSVAGKAYRLVLSNAYGTSPLHLTAVHVARPGKNVGSIDPASDKALRFSGKADVTIPPGMAAYSDPVKGPVTALSDLAISIHYDAAPDVQTSHPGSRQTSFVVPGDHTGDAELANAKAPEHWFQIAEIDVLAPADAGTLVALGDSITDGRGSTINGNDRWTNILASALQANPATAHLGVVNHGIGGNCVLVQCLGPSAVSRFERDVLAMAGVKSLVVLEGVNDLGGLSRTGPVSPEAHNALVQKLIAAFTDFATRAKAKGIKTYIGTILPYSGNSYYHPDAANEADRQAVNAWIRSQTLFDAFIDFDEAMRDPSHPSGLNPAYDTGDFLHPSVAGYKVMGALAAKVISAKEAQ